MEFVVQTKDLVHAAAYAGSVVEKKKIKPILSNIKMDAVDGLLSLIGTSMDMSIKITIGANVVVGGSLTVNAQNFLDVIKKIKDQTITLRFDSSTEQLKTAGKLFKSSFSTLSAKDFPVIDVVQEDVDSLTINAKSLLRLLSATEYAMFSGDGRYNMSCISLTASGGLLTAAAIDGHRFSIAREPVDNNSTMRIIVPSKSIYEIIKILKDPKYSSLDIKLQSDGRRISIAIGDVVMISRLVDAVFPEYESLIPTDFSSKLSIHTNVLYEIVDRVSAITVEDSRDIRFILSPNVIEVSGYGESKGAANEVLNNDDGAKFLYDGAEITFAVNAKYLTDVLRSMDEQEIEICFDKPNFPFVIKPSINTQDIFVIMPLDI